jgi:hypothetical protein
MNRAYGLKQHANAGQYCNNGIHAEVNAARNHLGRGSSEVVDVYKKQRDRPPYSDRTFSLTCGVNSAPL